MKFNESNKQNHFRTTLVIGIDIAKQKHVARAFTYRGIKSVSAACFKMTTRLAKPAGMGGIPQAGAWAVLLGVEPACRYWFPLIHFLKQRYTRPQLPEGVYADLRVLPRERKNPQLTGSLLSRIYASL
ncbi:hypothetical protein ABEV74_01320 [Paenibacillus cisolokensis]